MCKVIQLFFFNYILGSSIFKILIINYLNINLSCMIHIMKHDLYRYFYLMLL